MKYSLQSTTPIEYIKMLKWLKTAVHVKGGFGVLQGGAPEYI